MTLRPQLWFNLMLGAAVIVLCGLLVVGWVKLENVTTETHNGLIDQTKNRASNVAVWCGAINQGREYDRLFVQQVTGGHVTYKLADLPCTALEKATIKSATPKG